MSGTGYELLMPHWKAVYWQILWTTGKIPALAYWTTYDIDRYSSFGWWMPFDSSYLI